MSTPIVRIVDPIGADWGVREARGAAPLGVFSTKAKAIEIAEEAIRDAAGDGSVQIYDLNGALEAARSAIAGRFIGEYKHEETIVNGSLKAIDVILGFVAFAVPAALAPLFSPTVQASLGEGWVSVFIATFALSGGVAAATYVIASGGAESPQGKVAVVVACIVVTSLIATGLGLASLPLDVAFSNLHGPWYFALPAGLWTVATVVYGPVGALTGIGVGIWVGYVAVRRFGAP